MNNIKIEYVESSFSRCCLLTRKQIQCYGLNNNGEHLTLTIGSLNINVKKITISNREEANKLYLSKDLKEEFNIPEDIVFQLRKTDEDHLEIGPFIGIFISSKKIAALEKQNRDSVYERFTAASKRLSGLCCFFSIEDIDYDRNLIKALFWNKSKWVSSVMPLPVVIYDRCFGKGSREGCTKLRKMLGPNYQVINAMPKLTKWETINTLSINPRLVNLIPKTTVYHSCIDIENALGNFSRVYLKPNSLYNGKGIFRIRRGLNNDYIVEHRNKNENQVFSITNLNDINELLNKYKKEGEGYLIQQEIEKAAFRNQPFDLSLLYQKNCQGIWQPSGIAARVGAMDSVITNPRRGGSVEKISTVLKEVFNEAVSKKNGLYENIISIGKETAMEIDRQFGDCVELGLDMCIDVNGKIWIIEVNGKPLKSSLIWLNNSDITDRCYNRPIEYAVHLTGFESEDIQWSRLKTILACGHFIYYYHSIILKKLFKATLFIIKRLRI